MEQVIREYGRFLLGAVVCVGLLFVFAGMKDEAGNQGVFHIVGASLDKETENVVRYDVATFLEEGRKKAPTIVYRDQGVLYTGTCVSEEFFEAKDADGTVLAVQIKNITGPGGREWDEKMLAQMTEFCFPGQGIYRITVTAVDAWNRSADCVICIPVNERRKAV